MQEAATTVLIVDDEAMILNVLARSVRNKGYRVLTTTTPTEVVGILEKERVNILISDIDMPKMSGTALMAIVRQKFPEVVRILMTGRSSIDSTLKAINEGEVYRFLMKPFQEDELLTILREASARLKELHRVNAAAIIVARRDELCNRLDEQFPGISQVNQQDGVYLLPTDHIDAICARMSNPRLASLLKRRL